MLRKRLIGAAVLIAAVLGAWLGIAKPDPFGHPQIVRAMFDHLQGMALVQRNVRVGGVNVGTIGDVRRVGSHAEVELRLSRHTPIYRDARADLRPHTPFEGTTFVDLHPGSPGAGLLATRPIPLSQTSVFVSVGDVLGTFTAPVRSSFKTIVGELSRALAPPGQAGLRAALRNAPALLHQTTLVAPALRGPHRTELRSLIPSLAASVDGLAGPNGRLQAAIRGARSTLDAVAADNALPFDRSLARLPGALSSATSAGRRLVELLHQAGRTAITLAPALQEIAPTTRPLVGLLRRADTTLPRVPSVVDDFAVTLTDLARARPTLRRLFAAMDPVGRLLRYSLIPFFDSPTKFGLPVYLQLMAALSGFTGSLSSFVTGGQPIGNARGHALRGTLQAPLTLPLPPSSIPIPCSAIAALNPNAVVFLQQLGLCL
jgi:ABC-type transporter Mla subunit MlaD